MIQKYERFLLRRIFMKRELRIKRRFKNPIENANLKHRIYTIYYNTHMNESFII